MNKPNMKDIKILLMFYKLAGKISETIDVTTEDGKGIKHSFDLFMESMNKYIKTLESVE